MTRKIFEKRIEQEDDGPIKFFINGKQVGMTSYDEHGSNGMQDMSRMFSKIAFELGEQVATTYGEC